MKIGFIGLGNMARAMIGGMLQKEMVKPEEIIGSAKTRETREKMAAEYGIVTMEKNADVAAQADMLVLAVKPQFFEEVIHEIKDATRPETLIISIAAGLKMLLPDRSNWCAVCLIRPRLSARDVRECARMRRCPRKKRTAALS